MTRCPHPDALVAIGDALDWNTAEGLRHLAECEECREQLELLERARAAFLAEPVAPDTLRRIEAGLDTAARAERASARARGRWELPLEALLGGVTALVILASSRIGVDGPADAALGFALGAALLAAGRRLGRAVPALRQEETGA